MVCRKYSVFHRFLLRRKLTWLALLAVCSLAAAQEHTPQQVRDAVREYRQKNEAQIVRDYARLLAIPNVANDAPNIRANATLIKIGRAHV